ncbi:MAG: hypothetical protein EBU52_22990, partial [Cytophagia bacterium]|nr:hypothetical protein [Cytophagia bacterium]
MDIKKQSALANKFYELKKYDNAIAIYIELVKLPEYKHFKNNLGYCFQALNRHSEAKTVWLEHLTENNNAIHLYLALAYSAGQMQQWHEMRGYALKAIETKEYKEESYAFQQLSIAEYYLKNYNAAIS